MKIYNTRTQSDYDALMTELEEQGFNWINRKKPTHYRYWKQNKENTCIEITGKKIIYGSLDYYKEEYHNTPIIEYKADKQGETNDFIKEFTVKIYYNEITKKHYNSYKEAIDDCKKEMERQHDKN